MDRAELQLLAMAVETEWGLYEAIAELRAELSGTSQGELVTRARTALHALWKRGLIEIYLDSSRPPRDAAEERRIREELARRPGGEPTGPVAVGVHTPLSGSDIEAALASSSAWHPPVPVGDRPWFETPHPHFMATPQGHDAYRDELKPNGR